MFFLLIIVSLLQYLAIQPSRLQVCCNKISCQLSWVKMSLGTEASLGFATLCSMWTQLPKKKGHTHPTQFSAHVCCGQMAGWMKTPLGTEVDLGTGHIVLDGVPAPVKGAQQPPLFGPCLLWLRSPISATAELLYSNNATNLHHLATHSTTC